MKFAKGTTHKFNNNWTVDVWFDGEDLDDDPQVTMRISADQIQEPYVLVHFGNMGDGIPLEYLNEVMKLAEKFEKNIEKA